MPDFAEPLARLIQEFKRLPGIGQKSAQRLAFHVLRTPREDAQRLAQALVDVKDNLGTCAVCNNISDGELCDFCRDPHRDHSLICVVEEPHNILPIETTRQFQTFFPSKPRASSKGYITSCTVRFHRCAASDRINCASPTCCSACRPAT